MVAFQCQGETSAKEEGRNLFFSFRRVRGTKVWHSLGGFLSMSSQLRIGSEIRDFVRSHRRTEGEFSCFPSDVLFRSWEKRLIPNGEADKLLFGNADHNGCEYFGLRTEYVLYLQLQSVVLDLRVNELEESHSVNNL